MSNNLDAPPTNLRQIATPEWQRLHRIAIGLPAVPGAILSPWPGLNQLTGAGLAEILCSSVAALPWVRPCFCST